MNQERHSWGRPEGHLCQVVGKVSASVNRFFSKDNKLLLLTQLSHGEFKGVKGVRGVKDITVKLSKLKTCGT
jgi:4-hydroxy-3-methylbut-2-enyl diphosphate reductase IspH